MISKVMIISLLLMVILVNLAQTTFTDVPRKYFHIIGLFFLSDLLLAPPARPDRFHSKEELRRYLQKV